MRIVVMNIRAGGGQQIDNLLGYLDEQDPHTVLLTEWRQGRAGTRIEAWASGRGLHHASLTDGQTANGVFLASRLPFTAKSVTPASQHAGALMLARFDDVTMLACYFPVQSAKATFFGRCAEVAASHSTSAFLMAGDLNTGNQELDREAGGVRYFCATQFDDLTSSHGLYDLWRRSNGPTAREWTWVSRRQNGFRLDHAFANAAFVRLTNPACRYDHAPRGTFTDHSAMVVDCSMPADHPRAVS